MLPTKLPQWAPVSNVLKQLETTDEQARLNNAANDQKLADIEEDQLKEVLRYVFMVCGLRAQNLPAGDDKEFLHLYIRKFYGDHTGEEVRLAFDMAIQGKLDVDAKTYENFSVEYFARIMNAFRKAVAKMTKKGRKALIAPGPPPASPDHIQQINFEFAEYRCRMVLEKIQFMITHHQNIENAKRDAKG